MFQTRPTVSDVGRGLRSRRCFACPGTHFSTPLRPRCAPRPAAALCARSRPPLRSRAAGPQARDTPVLSFSHPSGHRSPALRSATTGPRAVLTAWCGGGGGARGGRGAVEDGGLGDLRADHLAQPVEEALQLLFGKTQY